MFNYCGMFNSNAINYAKWHLLLNELSFANNLDEFDIFRKLKYPKSSKLGASDDHLECVELVEESMPLAIARPFVEEFITAGLIDTVSTNVAVLKFDTHSLYCLIFPCTILS